MADPVQQAAVTPTSVKAAAPNPLPVAEAAAEAALDPNAQQAPALAPALDSAVTTDVPADTATSSQTLAERVTALETALATAQRTDGTVLPKVDAPVAVATTESSVPAPTAGDLAASAVADSGKPFVAADDAAQPVGKFTQTLATKRADGPAVATPGTF